MPRNFHAEAEGRAVAWKLLNATAFEYLPGRFKREGIDPNYTFRPYRKQVKRNAPYFRRAYRTYKNAQYWNSKRDTPYYWP